MVSGSHAATGEIGRGLSGDNRTGHVWSLMVSNGKATAKMAHTALDVGNLSSFGEDAAGELYLSSNDGTVYRIDAAP